MVFLRIQTEELMIKKKKGPDRRGSEFTYYLGYRYSGEKAEPLNVHRPSRHCNYDMPSKFTWHSGIDLSTLHLYIEALHRRDQLAVDAYMERGLVTDIEYLELPSANEPPPQITINTQRLLNLLRGEERLTCRADAVLNIVTGGEHARKFCLRTFTAFMVANGYFDGEEYKDLLEFDGNYTPFNGYKSALRKYGVEPQDYHAGINIREKLRKPQRLMFVGPEATVEETAPEPVKETFITETDHGGYVETIALAQTSTAKYYIRRLIHKGVEIYSATAYSLKGGWTVYHRDAARLLALGVKE